MFGLVVSWDDDRNGNRWWNEIFEGFMMLT